MTMCSVSWLVDRNGYQVFFNRDEQKSRALALPPQQLNIDGVEVLMPIDPQGMGSWISLNEYGLSLCLLNNYQGIVPDGELVSRGLLLRQLASNYSVHGVIHAFKQLELRQFAPFSLLVFDPELTPELRAVMALEWDGTQSRIHATDSPLFSSGVDLVAVRDYRLSIYQHLTSEEMSEEQLLKFHTQHHPEYLHMSTCMHRKDAHTVSFTHLAVTSDDTSMAYVAGCPCLHLTRHALMQHRYRIVGRASLVS